MVVIVVLAAAGGSLLLRAEERTTDCLFDFFFLKSRERRRAYAQVSLLVLTALLCASLDRLRYGDHTHPVGNAAPDSSDNGFPIKLSIWKRSSKSAALAANTINRGMGCHSGDFNCSFRYVLMDNLNFMRDHSYCGFGRRRLCHTSFIWAIIRPRNFTSAAWRPMFPK